MQHFQNTHTIRFWKPASYKSVLIMPTPKARGAPSFQVPFSRMPAQPTIAAPGWVDGDIGAHISGRVNLHTVNNTIIRRNTVGADARSNSLQMLATPRTIGVLTQLWSRQQNACCTSPFSVCCAEGCVHLCPVPRLASYGRRSQPLFMRNISTM